MRIGLNNVWLQLFTETDVLTLGLFVHIFLAPAFYGSLWMELIALLQQCCCPKGWQWDLDAVSINLIYLRQSQECHETVRWVTYSMGLLSVIGGGGELACAAVMWRDTRPWDGEDITLPHIIQLNPAGFSGLLQTLTESGGIFWQGVSPKCQFQWWNFWAGMSGSRGFQWNTLMCKPCDWDGIHYFWKQVKVFVHVIAWDCLFW